MTPAMQEIVLSFLTRMAFLFGEGHRDPEYQVRRRLTHTPAQCQHSSLPSSNVYAVRQIECPAA